MLLACGPHASSSTVSQEFSTDHFDKPIVGYSNFVGVPILSRLLLFSEAFREVKMRVESFVICVETAKFFFAGLCPAPRWGSAPDPTFHPII